MDCTRTRWELTCIICNSKLSRSKWHEQQAKCTDTHRKRKNISATVLRQTLPIHRQRHVFVLQNIWCRASAISIFMRDVLQNLHAELVKTKLSCNLLQKLQLQLLQAKLSCKNVQYFFVLLDFFAVRRLCREVFFVVRLLCCEMMWVFFLLWDALLASLWDFFAVKFRATEYH